VQVCTLCIIPCSYLPYLSWLNVLIRLRFAQPEPGINSLYIHTKQRIRESFGQSELPQTLGRWRQTNY
jgi:hypothetical protein